MQRRIYGRCLLKKLTISSFRQVFLVSILAICRGFCEERNNINPGLDTKHFLPGWTLSSLFLFYPNLNNKLLIVFLLRRHG